MKSIKNKPKFNPFLLAVVVVGLAVIGYFVLKTFAAPADAPVVGTKPFVKLFSQANGGFSGDATATANTLAQYYSHIHGEGSNPSLL